MQGQVREELRQRSNKNLSESAATTKAGRKAITSKYATRGRFWVVAVCQEYSLQGTSYGSANWLRQGAQCQVPDMSDDSNRLRQDRKSELPEFWSAGFYHRIVRTTIGRELRATCEVPQQLPHRMLTLLMQMNGQRGRQPLQRTASTSNAKADECWRRLGYPEELEKRTGL